VQRATSEILDDFVHGGYQAGIFILAGGWRDAPHVARFIRDTASHANRVVAQETAIWALAEYYSGAPETLPLLLDLGRNADSDEVRLTVLRALSNAYPDDEQVLSLLRDRKTYDPHKLVRIVAGDLAASLSPERRAG
jgi:hypothetical protein